MGWCRAYLGIGGLLLLVSLLVGLGLGGVGLTLLLGQRLPLLAEELADLACEECKLAGRLSRQKR